LVIASDTYNREVVVLAKLFGSVLLLVKHSLAAVTPCLKVIRVVRILYESHCPVVHLDVVSTDDGGGLLAVPFAENQHL